MPAYGNRLGPPNLVVGVADGPRLLFKISPRKAGWVGILNTRRVKEIGVVEGHMGCRGIGNAKTRASHDGIVPPVLIEVFGIEVRLRIDKGLDIDKLIVAPQVQRHGLPTAHHIGQRPRRGQRGNLGVELANLLHLDDDVGMRFVESIKGGGDTCGGGRDARSGW